MADTTELVAAIAELGAQNGALKSRIAQLEEEGRKLKREAEEWYGVAQTLGQAQMHKRMATNTIVFTLEVDGWTLRAGGPDVFIASIQKLMREIGERTDILRGKKYA